jgi:branched-subunit amino acid aminotransferase/4-amino-4-deoxychorismate lyase
MSQVKLFISKLLKIAIRVYLAHNPQYLQPEQLQFSTAANQNGVATITIRLVDNGGTDNGGVNTSAEYEFTITVNPVNDAPSFTAVPTKLFWKMQVHRLPTLGLLVYQQVRQMKQGKH